ncbi:MAG: TlpA disulfide reductase family protein [Calditrichota bacterium]
MNRYRIIWGALFLIMGSTLLAADKAPDFTLPDMDGNKFKLSEKLKQGPVLLDFWATWCKPCTQELPEIERLYKTYADKGLQVTTISLDNPKSKSKVKPFVKGAGYTFGVLYDTNSETRSLFGGNTIPLTMLISQEGMIVYRHLGYNAGDEKELEQAVRLLLKLDAADSTAAQTLEPQPETKVDE